jgi:hypothetical protein
MLDIAYPSLTQEGDAYVVGPVSDRPGEGYLWHYWIPWMALLKREQLRLRQLDQVLAEGGPFIFPLELRWEFIDWFARGMATDFLTPHIPSSVMKAVRAGKAIILLFYGHEARPLGFTRAADEKKPRVVTANVPPMALKTVRAGKAIIRQLVGHGARALGFTKRADENEQSAYDLIFGFLRRHDLPRGAVWFINGNLGGRPEYESWRRRRLGAKDVLDPFETRFLEPFSYMAQATYCGHEQGFDVSVRWDATKTAGDLFLHQATHLTLKPIKQGTSDIYAYPERPRSADALPPKLFLCMNRVTRSHRRTIVCHLLRRGFLERSLVSFRDDNPDQIHFDELEMETAWRELQKRQPLTIDRDLPLDFEDYFQSNSAAVKIGARWPYRDTCFSIVTETHFGNDTLFVSEKLWKPILNGHPFVVVGTPGTLAYLRSLGFRTFTPMIDERYDSLGDDQQRMQALFAAIDSLGRLDDNRRGALLEQLQPILAHNRHHMRHLRSPMARVLSEIEVKLTALS